MAQDQHPLNTEKTRTMKQKALDLLKMGAHLSELEGLSFGLGTSLRTRISELKKDGHNIKSYYCTTDSGARYKRYYLELAEAGDV